MNSGSLSARQMVMNSNSLKNVLKSVMYSNSFRARKSVTKGDSFNALFIERSLLDRRAHGRVGGAGEMKKSSHY